MKDEVIEKVSINAILPNPYQPASRIDVDMFTQQKFAESTKIEGMHQIPVCRKKDGKFEMGDGWLRLSGYKLRVSQGEKDCEMISVVVRDLTDQQMADMVFATNTVRKDLNPIELAQFYKKYLEGFKMTQEELGKKHNVTQGEIANVIRLLDLPAEIQNKIITQEISATHGRTLLQLKDPEKMVEFAGKIKPKNMSVADLDAAIKASLNKTPAEKPPQTPLIQDSVDEKQQVSQQTPTQIPKTRFVDSPDDKKKIEELNKEDEKPLQKVTMAELKAAAKLRKVSLVETKDGVLVSVMREGGTPFMKKMACDLEDIPLKMILEEAKGK
ncbi:MAG: ParB/RepB/Spo0J family partition protein [Dehalococcoidia bacterium]|nr:ParB/RepB/Spo0J family partition protein [Dehalococcoidia bacterium]